MLEKESFWLCSLFEDASFRLSSRVLFVCCWWLGLILNPPISHVCLHFPHDLHLHILELSAAEFSWLGIFGKLVHLTDFKAFFIMVKVPLNFSFPCRKLKKNQTQTTKNPKKATSLSFLQLYLYIPLSSTGRMLLSFLLLFHCPVMVNVIPVVQCSKEVIRANWEQFPFWPVGSTSLREQCSFCCSQTGALLCGVYSSNVFPQHLDLVQSPLGNLPGMWRKDITKLKKLYYKIPVININAMQNIRFIFPPRDLASHY